MENKWYNSEFASYFGAGIMLFGIFAGAGIFLKGCGEYDYKKELNKTHREIAEKKLKTIEKLLLEGLDKEKLEKLLERVRTID